MRHTTQSFPVLSIVRQIESKIAAALDQVFAQARATVDALVRKFVFAQVTPKNTFDFENELAEAVRELGRRVVERVLNLLEGDQPEQLPHDVEYEGGGYRRLNRKTRNAHVATLFGTIVLWRHPYRYWHRDVAEKCIFPLEIAKPPETEAAATGERRVDEIDGSQVQSDEDCGGNRQTGNSLSAIKTVVEDAHAGLVSAVRR